MQNSEGIIYNSGIFSSGLQCYKNSSHLHVDYNKIPRRRRPTDNPLGLMLFWLLSCHYKQRNALGRQPVECRLRVCCRQPRYSYITGLADTDRVHKGTRPVAEHHSVNCFVSHLHTPQHNLSTVSSKQWGAPRHCPVTRDRCTKRSIKNIYWSWYSAWNYYQFLSSPVQPYATNTSVPPCPPPNLNYLFRDLRQVGWPPRPHDCVQMTQGPPHERKCHFPQTNYLVGLLPITMSIIIG